MGCFCRVSAASLASQLPQLDAPASPTPPGSQIVTVLAGWLATHGLPAEPWSPDPAWLELEVPMPQMSAGAIATISALAQLRAQALAMFGLDLLIAAQANGFVRIIATLNARLAGAPAVNPLGWVQLATLNDAIDRVLSASRAGVFAPAGRAKMAKTMPGGIPAERWNPLLASLRLLAPLIAASLQLSVALGATAELGAGLRVLARLNLPNIASAELIANITAALSATASLQTSLGISPLQLGMPEIALRVQAKLGAALAVIARQFEQPAIADGTPTDANALLAMLPQQPAAPGNLATADVVRLAVQAQALASLNWQVPASLPSVATGLATCTLAAQMQAALGIQAVLPAPCGPGCDAAGLLRAALAV